MNTAVLWIITMLTMVHGGPVKRSKSVMTDADFDALTDADFDALTDADFDAARRRPVPSDAEIESEFENVWNSGYFEGDIKEDIDSVLAAQSGVAVRHEAKLWTNGRVPYVIRRNTFNSRVRAEIAAAILEYQKQTCIKFVPRRSERNYILFDRRDGCWSKVGRIGGYQPLSIGSGCGHKGVIMHEMMHALGFYHEQSRVDRDKYIKVLWDNIKPGFANNFKMYDLSKTQLLDTKYDYKSIMHYGEYGFSKRRGAPTIIRLQGTGRLGQREGFSETDRIEINRLYKCSTETPAPPTTGVTTGTTTTMPTTGATAGTTTTTPTTEWTALRKACIKGNNIAAYKTEDVLSCKSECEKKTNCRSMEYYPAGKNCHISDKDSSSRYYTEPCYISPKEWVYTEQILGKSLRWTKVQKACIKGNNIATLSGLKDVNQCKHACEQKSGCKSMEFNPTSQTLCHLSSKDSSSSYYTKPCYISPTQWLFAELV